MISASKRGYTSSWSLAALVTCVLSAPLVGFLVASVPAKMTGLLVIAGVPGALALVNIWAGFYLWLLAHLFYHVVAIGQYAIGIHVGGSFVSILDLITLLMLGALVVHILTKRIQLQPNQLWPPLIVFIAGLSVPLFVGLYRGNVVVTVLRDARPVAYYTVPLLVASVTRSKEDVWRLVKWVLLLATISLIHYYVSRILGVPFNPGALDDPEQRGQVVVSLSSGFYVRGYGIPSSWPYFLVSYFILLGLFHCNSQDWSEPRKAFVFVYMSAFALALLLLLARGVFLAMIAGTLWLWLRTQHGHRVWSKLGILMTVLLLAVLVSYTVNLDWRPILRFSVVERYGSLLDILGVLPFTVSPPGALKNAMDRLAAFTLMIRTFRSSPIFGMGYGDPVSLLRDVSLLDYFHNSWAWAAYRGGIVGTLAIVLGWVGFYRRTGMRLALLNDNALEGLHAGLVALVVAISVWSFAANILFVSPYGMATVVLIFALLIAIENLPVEEGEEPRTCE